MQIHEIFQKKRVNEASFGGAVGVAKAIAGGVASQLASTASQKVLGTDVFDKTGQDIARGPEAEQRARAASQSLIAQQAATNQKLWNQGVAEIMKRAGVGSADQLDATSRQSLSINLLGQLHKNFLQGKIKDYKQLPDMVEIPKPPSQTPPATDVVRSIETALEQIESLKYINEPVGSKGVWFILAQAAYDALALLQFHSKGREANAQGAIADPQTTKVLDAAGIGQDALTAINAAVRQGGGAAVKATGNPIIDGILKAAKLL